MLDADNGSARSVDLNSDLGESFGRWVLGDDEAILRVVSSANVACGFHAGDPRTLRRTCEQAAEQGVAVGAHVGYPDLHGFGRRFIDMDPDDLTAAVQYQVGALRGFCQIAGIELAYVKPHGALYNAVVHHEAQAGAIVRALVEYAPGLPLLGLPGSQLLDQASRAGLTTAKEVFADRAYTAAGTLLPRSEPEAVLHDPATVAARVVRMVVNGEVQAVDGSVVEVDPDSICVHGDSRNAVAMAAAVKEALEDAGVHIRPFTA